LSRCWGSSGPLRTPVRVTSRVTTARPARAGPLLADEYFLDADADADTVKDRTQPDLSPIYVDVTGLLPILIVFGADDVLLQDNLAIVVQLSTVGVDVNLWLCGDRQLGRVSRANGAV
jgi:acetyl esterase/lipase